MRQGNLEEVEALASRWAERNPLDVDALTLRATARAWRGDRDGALRVLSGTLASPSMTAAAQVDVASSLARAEERAGRAVEACALRVAAAEGKASDAGLVASAIACERAQARTASADRWLAFAKDGAARTRLSAAAAKVTPGGGLSDTVFGDVVVDATWDASAGVDLDVGIVDPSGRRLSWASAARNVRASDCTSSAHEAMAVSSGTTGRFVVEVVRAGGSSSDRPVSGSCASRRSARRRPCRSSSSARGRRWRASTSAWTRAWSPSRWARRGDRATRRSSRTRRGCDG